MKTIVEQKADIIKMLGDMNQILEKYCDWNMRFN